MEINCHLSHFNIGPVDLPPESGYWRQIRAEKKACSVLTVRPKNARCQGLQTSQAQGVFFPMFTGVLLEQVISGGQTGADRAALLAAESLGIPTGGWMPKGFQAADGSHPGFASRFGMREHTSSLYPPRTRLNIQTACATLCLEGVTHSRGVTLTRNLATKANKPLLRVNFTPDPQGRIQASLPASEVIAWIHQLRIRVLNVAGNEESRAPGIQEAAVNYLVDVFQPWARADSSAR